MIDYGEHCPSEKLDEKETFQNLSAVALKKYGTPEEPISNAEIEKHLRKLNSTLRAMPKQMKKFLIHSEIEKYPNRSSKAWFDNLERVRDGGSALDMLLSISEQGHKHPVRVSALKRHTLITDAIFAFGMFGGEIQAGDNSPFGQYLFALFDDAGIEPNNISKTIRDYIKR